MKSVVLKAFGIIILFLFLMIFLFLIYSTIKYPIKYKDNIIFCADTYNLNPYVISSVINVESSFNNEAVSNKGAIGLMQLMPSTANWLAKKMNMNNFKEKDLFIPDINIKLGSFYLKYLIERFEHIETALCAYNAGEGTVSNWLTIKEYSKDGVRLDSIPYKETKSYLEKLKINMKFYKLKAFI